MSHDIKLLLKIILKRLNKAIEEVEEMQFGFRKKPETGEIIFALKKLHEKCLQMQRDVYICFKNYKKSI